MKIRLDDLFLCRNVELIFLLSMYLVLGFHLSNLLSWLSAFASYRHVFILCCIVLHEFPVDMTVNCFLELLEVVLFTVSPSLFETSYLLKNDFLNLGVPKFK